MKTGDAKLVAYYSSMLSENDQIECYAEFLQNVLDDNERIKCLEAAEMCQLRIEEITKRVVQVMRRVLAPRFILHPFISINAKDSFYFPEVNQRNKTCRLIYLRV